MLKVNEHPQWLIAELQSASDVGQLPWRSLISHLAFRNDLMTATGGVSAAFHVDANWETWLYIHEEVQKYPPLFRQKLLLHELYHAAQYEKLLLFFGANRQRSAAFHSEICKQQSGFAILYARSEVEAEAFAIYTLINHYGRQTVDDVGLISGAEKYLRGYIIIGDNNFPRRLRHTYGNELENLYPTPESAIAQHKGEGTSNQAAQ